MSATAQSVAVEVPLAAPAAVESTPAPSPAPRRRAARGDMWVYPFGITLAGSLAVFLWQMAEYTTLLG